MHPPGVEIAHVASVDREHLVAGLEAHAGAVHRGLDAAYPETPRGSILAKDRPHRANTRATPCEQSEPEREGEYVKTVGTRSLGGWPRAARRP